MQMDMHFHGTYALARAAGLPPQVAKTVATAAQFVDDAVHYDPSGVGGESFIIPVVSAHKMVDADNVKPWDQWQVWLPFHFLPGGEGGNSEERLLCRKGVPGNTSADAVLKLAENKLDEPYGWHLLGIVTHVLQDTFSHWGFSGISSSYNHVEQGDIVLHLQNNHALMDDIMSTAQEFWEKVTGSMAEDVSSLGHGSVATYPDRPYLVWEFDYEMSLSTCARREGTQHVSRNNPVDFLAACERLFNVYNNAAMGLCGAEPISFSTIETAVLNILTVEARMDGRIAAWKDAMVSGSLFPVDPLDTELRYEEDCWAPGSLPRKPKEQKLEAQLFFKASRNYRCHILGQLLPSLGLL